MTGWCRLVCRSTAWLAVALFGPSCSGELVGSPSAGSYTVAFPSSAAAIASETVQIMAFDVGDAGRSEVCPSLIVARRTGQGLPPAVATGDRVSPCQMLAGEGALTVRYGVWAFLAVVRRAGEDYLVGCAVQHVGEGTPLVPISVGLAGPTVSVPVTTCPSLADKCAGRCG